jgi:RNase H-like domain found in reverse transcriptase/Integrase zinc binding domain
MEEGGMCFTMAASDKKLEVQSFLGVANYYRRFIKGFSHIAAPISNITRAKNSFLWSEKHDKAFAALKHAFTTAPELKISDPAKPYIVKTDASMSGIGALLEQEVEDGWHPVAFTSRKLQPAEENYPVHDLELMAIVYALHEWGVYLHGVAFEIVTDHHPLRYFDIQPKLSKRQIRWLEDLAEFNFKLRYMKGKYNLVADTLSRMYVSNSTKLYDGDDGIRSSKTAAEHANVKFLSVNVLNIGDVKVDKSVIAELQRDYGKDETYKEVYAEPGEQLVKTGGLLYDAKGTLCVPDGRLRSVPMHDAYDAIVNGHVRFDKCLQDLQNSFPWPTLRRDVKDYVWACDSCQRNKFRPQDPIGLLQPLEVPTRLEQVTLDFVMELPPTPSGHDAVLVIVDLISKVVRFCPSTTAVDAVGSAKLFFKEWYRLYGFPRKIVSDRDGRFINKVWQELFGLTQVELAMSSSHHP